jgi:hypothetical protein
MFIQQRLKKKLPMSRRTKSFLCPEEQKKEQKKKLEDRYILNLQTLIADNKTLDQQLEKAQAFRFLFVLANNLKLGKTQSEFEKPNWLMDTLKSLGCKFIIMQLCKSKSLTNPNNFWYVIFTLNKKMRPKTLVKTFDHLGEFLTDFCFTTLPTSVGGYEIKPSLIHKFSLATLKDQTLAKEGAVYTFYNGLP